MEEPEASLREDLVSRGDVRTMTPTPVRYGVNPEDCTAPKVMWHLLRKSRRVVLGLELGLCAILRQKVV